MEDRSIVRFADSVNNMVSGPSVSNYDLLTTQAENNILPETYMVSYKEKTKTSKYPSRVKFLEVDLEESSEVLSRMPMQPHFLTVNTALSIINKLKKNVLAVAVSGRYSPQTEQFCSLLRSNHSKNCKLIVEGHGSDVCGYQLRQFENLFKNIYRKADLVILMETPFAKIMFEKDGFPTGNMVVCPTVVRWEKQVDYLKNNSEILTYIKNNYFKKYNIPENADYIISIGRFQPEKGHYYIIRAAKKILKRYPNLYFLLGGSGKGTVSKLKRLIGGEERIKLIGMIPFSDMYALIANALAFIIASIEIWNNGKLYFAETGPRTVVDAMAAGTLGKTVIISSNSGGTTWKFNMDEWLEESSKSGFHIPNRPNLDVLSDKDKRIVYSVKNRALFFPQADSKSLAAAIELLINDNNLSKKLNNEASKYVKKWYNSVKIAKTYNSILEQLT
ncbi:MAG: glycosyltransferase family 4 protein [Candidatus Odinarchaeia archaeon]